MEDIWKDYDAETKYPDVTAYILTLIRENKKLKEKAEKLDELFPNPHIIEETGGTMCELLIEQAGKLEALKRLANNMAPSYQSARIMEILKGAF